MPIIYHLLYNITFKAVAWADYSRLHPRRVNSAVERLGTGPEAREVKSRPKRQRHKIQVTPTLFKSTRLEMQLCLPIIPWAKQGLGIR